MEAPIRTFRDLIVWQKSMVLVTAVYHISRLFPKEEIYGLNSQIRRSAVSIPSNLAEGYARRSRAEYVRFVQISIGSLYELETQLEIAANLDFIPKTRFSEINEKVREIDRMLCSLHQKLTHPKQSANKA